MDLGKRFKFYREKAGLRQNKAAELIGVKNYQLGNYETNRSEPSIDVLKRMKQGDDDDIGKKEGISDETSGRCPFAQQLVGMCHAARDAEELSELTGVKLFVENHQ